MASLTPKTPPCQPRCIPEHRDATCCSLCRQARALMVDPRDPLCPARSQEAPAKVQPRGWKPLLWVSWGCLGKAQSSLHVHGEV